MKSCTDSYVPFCRDIFLVLTAARTQTTKMIPPPPSKIATTAPINIPITMEIASRLKGAPKEGEEGKGSGGGGREEWGGIGREGWGGRDGGGREGEEGRDGGEGREGWGGRKGRGEGM